MSLFDRVDVLAVQYGVAVFRGAVLQQLRADPDLIQDPFGFVDIALQNAWNLRQTGGLKGRLNLDVGAVYAVANVLENGGRNL